MKNTDRKAKSGMIIFVLTIFTLGVMIAAVYFLTMTPGDVQPAG